MPDEQVIPAEEQEGAAASSEEVTTATESATGDSNEPHPEAEAKAKNALQKRFDKLTREREFWKEQALATKPVAEKPAPVVETAVAPAEPKEDDFETHAAYVKALTKYTAKQAVEDYKAEQRTESAKTQKQTAVQTFQEKQAEFKASTPDFDEVLADADMQVSQAVIDEIISHDHGAALQYFLAKNPDEADRLSKLAPVALAREVGRLESRFTTAPQKTAAKVTNAPAPPNPVGKSSGTSTKSLEEMSMQEYKAARRKQNPNFDR